MVIMLFIYEPFTDDGHDFAYFDEESSPDLKKLPIGREKLVNLIEAMKYFEQLTCGSGDLDERKTVFCCYHGEGEPIRFRAMVRRVEDGLVKIMQKFEIQCQVKMKRQKYINGESNIVVPNILNRNFKASQPNEKWVTDITYLPYGSTMLYLSTIIDLYNNEIVAYKIGTSQDINLVLETLRVAVELRKPVGLLLHSDQGYVYTSYAYQNLAKEKGITTSMSRKGNCHDNAVIESFHSSLKSEGFNAQRRASMFNSKVVQIVNQYMYRYNHIRIQAKLNYLSPLEYGGQAA
jgi:hypothetical protein